jgi:hypothetical protein
MSADLLVVGRTTPASESILVDCQLIDSHGAVLGTASIRDGVPITDEVRGLLRWQQRPEQTVAGKTDLAELCLDYSFDVLRHGKYSTQLTDDMTMRTGEKFRLRVRPLSDCYVYLLLFDSAGKAEVLLPHARIVQSNQLRGGVLYTFPSPTLGYELVPPTGTEHLWLVASYEPLSELKDLISKLEAGGDAVAVSQHIRKHVEEVATRGMKVQGDQPQELKSGYQVRGLPPSSLRSVIIGGESVAGDSSPQLLQCNGATTALVQLRIQHK